MKTKQLSINGMGCGGCASAVQQALEGVEGVESVKVDLDSATATISYDETKSGQTQFSEVLSEAGYALVTT